MFTDDEHYPFICASVGDRFPQLSVVHHKESGSTAEKNLYYGPYTSYREINEILDSVEAKYNLRHQSFLARNGDGSRDEYMQLFDTVIKTVFSSHGGNDTLLMKEKRKEYEEAGLLFESDFNKCRDVVAVGKAHENSRDIIVYISQLREGLVADHYSYMCTLPRDFVDEDVGEVLQTVLSQRHYPSGANARTRFSWFPDDILLSQEASDMKLLRKTIRKLRNESLQDQKKQTLRIDTVAKSGKRKEVDARVMQFAKANAHQAAIQKTKGIAKSLIDGRGAEELAMMVGLEKAPSRIECYVSF